MGGNPDNSQNSAKDLIRRLAEQIRTDHNGEPAGTCATCGKTGPCPPANLAGGALAYAGNRDRPITTEELNAVLGYEITAEGRARARAKLDAARARWTPERWAALRTQLGLPPEGPDNESEAP